MKICLMVTHCSSTINMECQLLITMGELSPLCEIYDKMAYVQKYTCSSKERFTP